MSAAKNTKEISTIDKPFAGEQIQELPLELLEASPNNPRRTMDEAGLQELAASIRAQGITSPLLVRPRRSVWVRFKDESTEEISYASPAECSELLLRKDAVETSVEDRYEIVAGHRRSEAATLAGRSTVPCLVRDLTDAEAAERALVDNLQRVDVPPMEEAEAFGKLLGQAGSKEVVAAKVGKEVGYVAKSLKLLDATLATSDALRHRLITVDHVRLLVRVADAEQNAALKWCLDTNAGVKKTVEAVIADQLKRNGGQAPEDEPGVCSVCGCTEDDPCDLGEDGPCGWANERKTLCNNPECLEEAGVSTAERRPVWKHEYEPQSVQRLKEHMETVTGIPLDRAPWPMNEDYLLPDVGACDECPKNTRANTPLFGDMEMGVAVCTDGACFKAKTSGFVALQLVTGARTLAAELGKSEVEARQKLRVSWRATVTAPRKLKDGSGPNPAQVFKFGQWVEATAACPHSILSVAVTVDWSGDGNRGHGHGDANLRKPGEILRVCIEPGCKIHPKGYEKAQRSRSSASKPDDPAKAAERKRNEELVVKEEAKIRSKIFVAAVGKLSPEAAVRLVTHSRQGADATRKAIAAQFEISEGALLEALTLFSLTFQRHAEPNAYWIRENGIGHDRKELWAIAKQSGVNPDLIAAQHFHDAGSIAPWADKLYPKGIKWPKGKAAPRPATAKPSAKNAASKPAKKKALSASARKRIADAMKKRWAKPAKAVAKKAVAK